MQIDKIKEIMLEQEKLQIFNILHENTYINDADQLKLEIFAKKAVKDEIDSKLLKSMSKM